MQQIVNYFIFRKIRQESPLKTVRHFDRAVRRHSSHVEGRHHVPTVIDALWKWYITYSNNLTGEAAGLPDSSVIVLDVSIVPFQYATTS